MNTLEQNIDSTHSTSGNLPKNWAKAADNYTANEMIIAYLSGKKAGKKEQSEKLQSEFSINVKLATSIAEELLEIGSERNLKFNSIFLKASALNSFEALFLVDPHTIEKDEFREAYVLSRTIRNKYKTDRFNLSFSFTEDSDQVDKYCLSSDGYFMRYEKGKEA